MAVAPCRACERRHESDSPATHPPEAGILMACWQEVPLAWQVQRLYAAQAVRPPALLQRNRCWPELIYRAANTAGWYPISGLPPLWWYCSILAASCPGTNADGLLRGPWRTPPEPV